VVAAVLEGIELLKNSFVLNSGSEVGEKNQEGKMKEVLAIQRRLFVLH